MSKLNPKFDTLENPETFINHVEQLIQKPEPLTHDKILNQLLEQFETLDFKALAFPQLKDLKAQLEKVEPGSNEAEQLLKDIASLKLNDKHFLILSIEEVLKVADKNKWGLCKNQDFIYLYNGAYWADIDKESFQKFLGKASEKMGVAKYSARFHVFREQLLKQFLSEAYLPTPETPKDLVYINLKNGTFEVKASKTRLRGFNQSDFITYQLPFEYDPEAQAPMFEAYLNKVLPDANKERQKVLAEFLGYVFVKNGGSALKEEKALVLYGTGANGKSVFFEIITALLGRENVSSHSIQSLTDENGYYRAMIANKLANYASEMNGSLETSLFKAMASGEPIPARLPYGRPMELTQYAKLIFNCNELPKDVEHTNAYFRRFLIIPFDVTIPEHEQDKRLHIKIIQNELSGVFNWILAGLNRLLQQGRFSECKASVEVLNRYKTESDSVKLFIQESSYEPHPTEYKTIKEVYTEYRTFCIDDGFRAVNKSNFMKRLKNFDIQVERKAPRNVAFMSSAKINVF